MNKGLMKAAIAIVLVGSGIGLGSLWSASAEGESVTPGSAEDPVVTKSYVDKALAGGGTGAADAQKQLQVMIDQFRAEIQNQQQQPQPQTGVKSEVVLVKKGQTLIADAGAQFVLRAGKGVAFSADANGISDVTAGIDIKNGEKVPNNHLIIFPREGRGVTLAADSPINLTVLVIGGYKLQ